MASKFWRGRLGLIAVAIATSTPALAHPGSAEEHGVVSGLVHPFTGMDHLAAIVGIGLLATLIRGRVRWDIPLSFLLLMGVGGVAGLGNPVAAVETSVAISVMCVGLWILALRQGTQRFAMPAAGVVGFLHGWAHGAGQPLGVYGLLFLAGALVTTLLLSGAGAALGARLAAFPIGRSIAGGVIFIAGVGALVG